MKLQFKRLDGSVFALDISKSQPPDATKSVRSRLMDGSVLLIGLGIALCVVTNVLLFTGPTASVYTQHPAIKDFLESAAVIAVVSVVANALLLDCASDTVTRVVFFMLNSCFPGGLVYFGALISWAMF